MLNEDILGDCLVELPPFGSFPVKGFKKTMIEQPARFAYFVVDSHGPEGSIVGAVCTVNHQNYFFRYKEVYQGREPLETAAHISGAMLVKDDSAISQRTCLYQDIQGQLTRIPAQDRATVRASLKAVVELNDKLSSDVSDYPALKIA